MTVVILIGSAVIVATMAVASGSFEMANRGLRRLEALFERRAWRGTSFAVLIAAVLWIQLVLSISIWSWALLYRYLGLFTDIEPALYFAIVSFTTVGYGDLVLDPEWRLLAGMTATNGLLIFGLFTAFLVDVVKVLRAS
ncbi:MAG: two pore domain potassium channel family protein [Litoreibacter sp.]|nr:two pore domain potassium channel family protein [Litoreibacter sp.]